MSITRLMQASLSMSLALALGPALPVLASDLGSTSGCTRVEGNLTEFVADQFLSPFDPFGRVVSVSDGSIQAVGTAVLTSVGPGPSGTLVASAKRVLVLNPNDQIFATDSVVFTPIASTPDVNDVVTITIQGGLGKFLNASGQIVATGRGFNFFPLPPGPVAGKSYFSFHYVGQVCVP